MSLSLEDRQEIQDLVIRYAQAVDMDGTEEEFRQILMPGAVIDGPAGRETLDTFLERLRHVRDRHKRHILSNFIISGDKDRATVKVYFMIAHVEHIGAGSVGNARQRRTSVSDVGQYDCEVCRVEGAWRLAQRISRPLAPLAPN
jgi:hypothetical protein